MQIFFRFRFVADEVIGGLGLPFFTGNRALFSLFGKSQLFLQFSLHTFKAYCIFWSEQIGNRCLPFGSHLGGDVGRVRVTRALET